MIIDDVILSQRNMIAIEDNNERRGLLMIMVLLEYETTKTDNCRCMELELGLLTPNSAHHTSPVTGNHQQSVYVPLS